MCFCMHLPMSVHAKRMASFHRGQIWLAGIIWFLDMHWKSCADSTGVIKDPYGQVAIRIPLCFSYLKIRSSVVMSVGQ